MFFSSPTTSKMTHVSAPKERRAAGKEKKPVIITATTAYEISIDHAGLLHSGIVFCSAVHSGHSVGSGLLLVPVEPRSFQAPRPFRSVKDCLFQICLGTSEPCRWLLTKYELFNTCCAQDQLHVLGFLLAAPQLARRFLCPGTFFISIP